MKGRSMFRNYVMFKSMRDKPVTGFEAMIGKEAVVIENIDPEGKIDLQNEIWTATTGGKKVVKARGLVLIVESMDENEKPSDRL